MSLPFACEDCRGRSFVTLEVLREWFDGKHMVRTTREGCTRCGQVYIVTKADIPEDEEEEEE